MINNSIGVNLCYYVNTVIKKEKIQILDPDGWRKDGKSFNAPLTEKEWNERMIFSTVSNVHLAAKQIHQVAKKV